jgi:cyclophilin family peptidyl-prolyl cis-trans isomerase
MIAAGALAFSGAAWAQESVAPAPEFTGQQIVLQTSMGDITIVLDPAGAPITSDHFLKNVRAGHYVGAAFYRIEPGFLIQLGDSDVNGKYRPPKFKPIPLETATNKHSKYAVGLAHGDDPNSGQTTFYIDLADNPGLNAKEGAPPNTTGFAAFGKVIAGFDVVEAIAAVERAPTGGPFPGKLPATPVFIKKAVVVPAK